VVTARSEELRAVAQRVADALPSEVVEVVLTGSVSRGVADEVSDIEMLVVTVEPCALDACFELARVTGLEGLDTWAGAPPPAQRVSGFFEGLPVELIFWPREHAESRIELLLRGELPSETNADALVHGISLRTAGLLVSWQARLREYPPELAAARIEEAASRWCGFTPAGVLTIVRPGDRLALVEWMVDAAVRVQTIVYALNRTWQPTTKRLGDRLQTLAVKPERLAERVEEALTEPDPRRALLTMTELQLDALLLAPSGPNVDRARVWCAEAIEVLR
jgi:predicted nucleotidyltransferase